MSLSQTINQYLSPKTPQETVQIAFVTAVSCMALIASCFIPFFLVYAALSFSAYQLLISYSKWNDLAIIKKPDEVSAEEPIEPITKGFIIASALFTGLYLSTFSSVFHVALCTLSTVALSGLFIHQCIIGSQNALNQALHNAVIAHDTEAVTTLLRRGADPFTPTPDGNTAFHLAIQNNDEAAVMLLSFTGYSLSLMSNLPNNNPNNAVIGKLYLSVDGTYLTRATNGEVHKGSLHDSNINMDEIENKINNPEFKKAVLEFTLNQNHTPYNYMNAPKKTIWDIMSTFTDFANADTRQKFTSVGKAFTTVISGKKWQELKNYKPLYQTSSALSVALLKILKTGLDTLTDYLRDQASFEQNINAKNKAGMTVSNMIFTIIKHEDRAKLREILAPLKPLNPRGEIDNSVPKKQSTETAIELPQNIAPRTRSNSVPEQIRQDSPRKKSVI